MLPAYWIAARDPNATVVVYPSDHFVLEGAAFMAHVAEVVAFVERQRHGIVLVGARAMEPDTEYGWIEPGDAVGATASGSICRVARFREKPTPQARCHVSGPGMALEHLRHGRKGEHARVGGRRAAARASPSSHGRHAVPWHAARGVGARGGLAASLPRQNFSEAVLQAGLPFLAVSALPPLTWSDLGTPQRLFKLLRILGDLSRLDAHAGRLGGKAARRAW